jgi:hypothetical protein
MSEHFASQASDAQEADMSEKLSELKNQLDVQTGLNFEMSEDLARQKEEIRSSQHALIEEEEMIQKEKLVLILQFEKIHKLQDFYNAQEKEELIEREPIEVQALNLSHAQVRDMIADYYQDNRRKNRLMLSDREQIIFRTYSLRRLLQPVRSV